MMSAWGVTANVQAERTVFYPGNIVTGVVNVQVSMPSQFIGIRLVATGEEYVKVGFQVPRQRPDGTTYYETQYVENTVTLYRQVVTLAGQMETGGMQYPQALPVGTWTYPFQLKLPTNLPPTMYQDGSNLDLQVRYNLECVVDVPGGHDSTHKVPFTVLSPIPISQWQTPSQLTKDLELDVDCCICISKGKVSMRFWMDRTVVALDRDSIAVYAGIDNTAGEEPVEAVHVTLVNTLKGRCQGKDASTNSPIAHLKLPERVEPGQKKEVNGVVQLKPLANPTASSLNIVSTYNLTVSLDIPWATDPSVGFPVVVAHSVDDTNFLPRKDFGGFFNFQPAYLPETYYQPPPVFAPQYQVNMMPLQAPQNAVMWQPYQGTYQNTPGQFFYQQ